MTFPTTVINGHTYTDTDYQADRDATMALIANDMGIVANGITAVGLKSKALSDANTTLSGPESQGLLFVFTGALTAARTVTFASGFTGNAFVVNKTTGGNKLTMAVAGGPTGTVDCPASGNVILACDGSTVIHMLKVSAASAGPTVTGNLAVTGNLSATGTFGSGNATITGTIDVSGAATFTSTGSFGDDLTTAGDLGAGGLLSITGTATFGGLTTAGAGLNVTGNTALTGNLITSGTTSFGDTDFSFSLELGNPLMRFDTSPNTYVKYFRADEYIQTVINGTTVLELDATDGVLMPSIPSSAGVTNALWRDSGVVSIV